MVHGSKSTMSEEMNNASVLSGGEAIGLSRSGAWEVVGWPGASDTWLRSPGKRLFKRETVVIIRVDMDRLNALDVTLCEVLSSGRPLFSHSTYPLTS